MPLANLAVTDTFRTWFERTNELVVRFNTAVVSDNNVVYGVFTLGANSNTSLAVTNTFFVNTTSILAKTVTTLAANVTVTSNAAVVSIASGTLLLQSPTGTIVNASPFTVNAPTTLLGTVSISNTVSVTGNVAVTGSTILSGNTTANGTFIGRHLLMSGTGALVTNALSSASYNDYAPTGINDAGVLNLTPSLDTVLTGIQAPTGLGTGSRILYIQNLSPTYKITLPSGNTSSVSTNRIKTANDIAVDILPGTAIALIYSSTNAEWHVVAPAATTIQTLTVSGASVLNGTFTANNLATFNANAAFGSTFIVDLVNNRVGVRTAPSTDFHVVGNTILGVVSMTGALTLSANLTSTANASLSNGAIVLNAGTLAITVGNTFTANSSSQSYVRNLLTSTLTSNASAIFANVSVTGNASITGVTTISGTAGRLVIPVGASKWAT